jgi:hypothetical protein
MYCYKCGRRLLQDALYCHKCGTTVPNEVRESAAAASEHSERPAQQGMPYSAAEALDDGQVLCREDDCATEGPASDTPASISESQEAAAARLLAERPAIQSPIDTLDRFGFAVMLVICLVVVAVLAVALGWVPRRW